MYFVDVDDYTAPIDSTSGSDTEFTDSETSHTEDELSEGEYCSEDSEVSFHQDNVVSEYLPWIHFGNLDSIFEWKYCTLIFRQYQHVVLKKNVPGLTISYVPPKIPKLHVSKFVVPEQEWINPFVNFVPLYVAGQPDVLH